MPYKNKDQEKAAKKRYEEKRAGRTRNYATVVYPSKEYLENIGSKYNGANGYGSAPEDWKERLSELHVPVLISPLHDRDKNPDKSIKKPHYHVLFMFDTVKDFETQVKPIFELIGGVGRETVRCLTVRVPCTLVGGTIVWPL